MSLYRNILAAIAAVAIATPVFADDTTTTTTGTDSTPAAQTSDSSAATTTTTTTTSDASTTDTKVNLNKATAKELMKVKGINASKARAIVAYRKKHGDFKSTDDLSNVKGFKSKKMTPDMMKEITDQLTVE